MRFAVVLAFGFLALPSTASAQIDKDDLKAKCVCPSRDLKSRSKSEHVFIGKAVEKNDAPEHAGEAMPADAEFRFEVTEWLKGELPDPVLVRTFRVTCTTTFEIGATYAVFGNRNEYGQMTASYCSGNRVATDEVIAELKSILKEVGPSTNGAKNGNGGNGEKPANGSKASKQSGSEPAGDKKDSGGMSRTTLLAIGAAAVVLLILIVTVIRRRP